MYQIELYEYHESGTYSEFSSGSKQTDISKSISVVKMQYTPHQAYASKSQSRYGSVTYWKNILGHAMVYVNKDMPEVEWILQPTYTRLFKLIVSVVSEGL
jgi:hypothetical protein